MVAVELLTLGLALAIFLSVFRRNTARPRDDTLTVYDPAIARSALIVDHGDAFANRPSPPTRPGRPVRHSISSLPYGPAWRAVRSNLTGDILRRARLGAFAPLEREAAEALVAGVSAALGASDVAVRHIVHRAIFGLIARLCFGDDIDARDLGNMRRVLEEFFDSYAVVKASESSWLARLRQWRLRRRYAGTYGRLDEAFMPTVMARRRHLTTHQGGNGGGLRPHLDSLLELRVPTDDDDGEHSRRALTDAEVVMFVWEFLGAGTLSLMSCVEWTLAHLAAKPEIQEKLHREVAAGDQGKDDAAASALRLPYLHAVVLESLRLHPPVPFVVREVHAEGIALGKAVVPPGGARVRFVLGAIGRDGQVWSDPEEFRPERFLDGGEGEGVSLVPGQKEIIKMMPFGAGRRHCPGVAMGMAHIKCFLAELVREFEWAPPVEGGIDFTEVDGFRKSMKTPLRVRITRRSYPK
ncbi:hypothetical protein ACP4OV_010234 [Aristida adscensionis]